MSLIQSKNIYPYHCLSDMTLFQNSHGTSVPSCLSEHLLPKHSNIASARRMRKDVKCLYVMLGIDIDY